MITGLRAAANSMLAELRKQDVHAHNLANVNTTGYRRQSAARSSCSAKQTWTLKQPPLAMTLTGARDLTTGPTEQTGNPLDLALPGPGFLTVQTPQR